MAKFALTLALLVTAGNEMQKLMGMNPPFNPADDFETCKLWIEKAIKYVDPVTDRFTADTQAVIDELKGVKPVAEESEAEGLPQAPPAEVDETFALKTEIETATRLRDLKDIATEYPEFKSIRGQLSSFKTAEDLKEKMLSIFGSATEYPPEEEKIKEKLPETKPLPKSEPKSKPIAKPSGEKTMASFIDDVVLVGGSWEDMIAVCQEESTKRGYKIPINRSALNTHLKYRMTRNPEFLGKLTITDAGIE